MARKGNAKVSSNGTRAGTPAKPPEMPWGGFVNVRIDDETKAQFELWLEDNQIGVWDTYIESVNSGLKFSLSYDPDGDFYTASFTNTPRNPCGCQSRLILTSRAESWERAVGLLLFKHEVMMSGDWGRWKPRTGEVERFG